MPNGGVQLISRALRLGVILAASQYSLGYAQNPSGNDRSRSFAERNCRITLPDGAEWSTITPLPTGALAMYEIPQVARVMVLAVKLPQVPPINDAFIRGFEENFLADGWKKISGTKVRFKDLDAYDLEFQVAETGQAAKVRVFNTADFGYQIQVAGSPQTVAASATLQACLASFEFLRLPESPGPLPADSMTPWIWYIIRVATWCVVVTLVLWMTVQLNKRSIERYKA